MLPRCHGADGDEVAVIFIRTERELILRVTELWEVSYSRRQTRTLESVEILEKLKKLDLNIVSAQVIDDIIGNDSWTRIKCSECLQRVQFVLQFSSHVERYAVCAACFHKAFELMETKTP